jgi:hypothetical protein
MFIELFSLPGKSTDYKLKELLVFGPLAFRTRKVFEQLISLLPALSESTVLRVIE